VHPDNDYDFVDRFGRTMPKPMRPIAVRMESIRLPEETPQQPVLSVMFIRWGGRHRLGEFDDSEAQGDTSDGSWGHFGSPPSDWYLDAVVQKGVLRHPVTGGSSRNCEVLSIFVGSENDMEKLAVDAREIAALARGKKTATFWMLWPADFPTDWDSDNYCAYVDRRSMFAGQRAFEASGMISTFPHPADVWEFITGKAWMSTLANRSSETRLPACVLVNTDAVARNAVSVAHKAMQDLEMQRGASLFAATGGPAVTNINGVHRGVVKIGWSWEAKFVYFWKSEAELVSALKAMVAVPYCSADYLIVQEWVDFDMELRFFFFPPQDWTPGQQRLEPVHHEYTAWRNKDDAKEPETFLKPSKETALKMWDGDKTDMATAHKLAIDSSQHLIAELLTKHNRPVPMIRMDWMLKRKGPGDVQVVFGEYCEMGACCLKWEEGPPKIWKHALDFALNAE
jgi:hypothetical protein